MLLEESDLYSLHRRGRYLFAALKRPHRVLSTFGVNGGLREDLTHIANHQSCDESALLAAARTELDATTATVFARNRLAIVHDPQSAAAAYGLAEILDLTRAGVLHAEAARESILNQAAPASRTRTLLTYPVHLHAVPRTPVHCTPYSKPYTYTLNGCG
jgi:hypothetical protein